jgi:hypothetical protein
LSSGIFVKLQADGNTTLDKRRNQILDLVQGGLPIGFSNFTPEFEIQIAQTLEILNQSHIAPSHSRASKMANGIQAGQRRQRQLVNIGNSQRFETLDCLHVSNDFATNTNVATIKFLDLGTIKFQGFQIGFVTLIIPVAKQGFDILAVLARHHQIHADGTLFKHAPAVAK